MQMVDSSRARDEPLTLELGVSEIVSNPLLSAMEQAVRSHGVGALQGISCSASCSALSRSHRKVCCARTHSVGPRVDHFRCDKLKAACCRRHHPTVAKRQGI